MAGTASRQITPGTRPAVAQAPRQVTFTNHAALYVSDHRPVPLKSFILVRSWTPHDCAATADCMLPQSATMRSRLYVKPGLALASLSRELTHGAGVRLSC